MGGPAWTAAVGLWLDEFNAALRAQDARAAAALFLTDSFWRDLVALLETFLPALRADGVSEATIETVTVHNPRAWLTITNPD